MKVIVKVALLQLVLGMALSVNAQYSGVNSIEPIGFEFRNLGAFKVSAWIGEMAIPLNAGDLHKNTFYVAPRAGGVWKTTNSGTTFECISDIIGTTYIGDVEVAPSNPEILWIGTGEDYSARSSYYGNGIWKSEDAGSTWENMGLEDSHHIAEIIIHPTNPDILWVAVMGHLYSENSERGVFKTMDGGLSWDRVLFIDEATGVIDIEISPENSDILYACSYEKVRLPWTFEPGGMKSRIYKTIDGGEDWTIIKGGGFPEGPLGRIGIDLQHNNPDVVVAVVQNLNVKEGFDPNAPVPFDEFTDHSFDMLVGGEAYRSMDAGLSWERLNNPEEIDVSGKAAYSFNKIAVDPDDPDKIFIIGAGMSYTLDGGLTWPRGRNSNRFRTNFGDNRALWIDPRDGEHMFLGSDGGIYETWDGGVTMMHYHNLPLGEIYMVEVDRREPYNIYIGLQDHEVWKGPSNGWRGQIGVEDWVIVGMWDGMYCKVDPEDDRWIYFTSQFGAHHRVDQSIGERISISPVPPEGKDAYRYTWNTPLVLSPHNSKTLYTGGQMLLRSQDQGDTWEEISPDLSYNNREKIAGTGHVMYCTIVSIDESPLKPGIIWVGTDDGRVHMTQNNGKKWSEFTEDLEELGVPHERWVGRIIASRHKENTAYVAKNGYRNDDFKPYLYVTDDLGLSWRDISSNLPNYPVNVIFEDHNNPDLLFVGNDIGVFYSLNRGKTWKQLKANLPPVVVRDLLVHPIANDLVVGTYGRAAWVADISPLQQFTEDIRGSEFHLFDIESKPQMNFSQQSYWGNHDIKGSNQLRTDNENNALELWFWFTEDADDSAEITLSDETGKELFKQKVKATSGFAKVYCNTMRLVPGTYSVSMKYRNLTIEKDAIVKERWLWPVLNY